MKKKKFKLDPSSLNDFAIAIVREHGARAVVDAFFVAIIQHAYRLPENKKDFAKTAQYLKMPKTTLVSRIERHRIKL